METGEEQESSLQLSDETAPQGLGKRTFLLGLSLMVILVSVFGTVWMLNTVPRSRRRKARSYATLVQVKAVQRTQRPIVIEAMGTVRAAQRVTLFPQVRGEIKRLHPNVIPGGFVRKGQWLLRIDPSDYSLIVAQRKSALAQAKAALALEKGQRTVAKREWKLLGKSIRKGNKALIMRQPQIDTANANVKNAQAALSQARLQLRRTLIRTPFDAVIVSRNVDKGSRVTESTSMIQLAGTRACWIELAIPVDQLKWVTLPKRVGKRTQPGSQVRIYNPDAWGPKTFRIGRVLRLYPSLETQGRMARLLVELNDPLAIASPNAPRLLLGSYVKAEIIGKQAPPSIALPREYLRDQQTVWLLSSDNKLVIRPVSILYQGPNNVLVGQGLSPGDKLITTLLPTPVNGMPLRTEGTKRRRRNRR